MILDKNLRNLDRYTVFLAHALNVRSYGLQIRVSIFSNFLLFYTLISVDILL